MSETKWTPGPWHIENNDRCYEDDCMRNNATLQPGDHVCTKGMTEEQYYAIVKKFMEAGVNKISLLYSHKKYAADGRVESYLGWDSRDNELWDCGYLAVGFDGREWNVEELLGGKAESSDKDVTPNYYAKWYKGVKLDPYRIASLYEIGGGPQEQVLKKALRGCHKGHEELQVIKEIRQALDRWEEMLEEDSLATSQRDTDAGESDNMIKTTLVQDDDSHWYLIPFGELKNFILFNEEGDDDMVEQRFNHYRLDGGPEGKPFWVPEEHYLT